MTVINLNDKKILKGAFADIILDKDEDTVLKIFKSYDHCDLNGTGKEQIGADKTNEFRKKVFLNEKDAYENAKSSTLLQHHLPQYFGSIFLKKIMYNEQDITYKYLPDCCYKMKFIKGTEIKLNLIRANPNLLKTLEI
jgi:hypothetical protein